VSQPIRLQLSRRKGFNLQKLSRDLNGRPTACVARPTRWGNPFTVADARDTRVTGSPEDLQLFVVECFRQWLAGSDAMWMGAQSDRQRTAIMSNIESLRGKNLACWCKRGAPCHADVLLELANRPACEEVHP
jgi:hypothetical protein